MSNKIDNDTKHLLLSAKNEVLQLRRVNEILGAKVEVMELFACVLHTQAAHQGGGMGIDVVWEIDRALNEQAIASAAGQEAKNGG